MNTDVIEHVVTPNPISTDRYQSILSRLEGCHGLVMSELEEYRQPLTGIVKEMASAFKLSIVVPVYNEVDTIARVISRLAALPLNTEIIVIDDNSSDGTREVLGKLSDINNLRIFLKSSNQGKGAALRSGFAQVSGDFVVIQDADLEYNPRDIPKLLEPLLNRDADVVYGSRFIGEELQDESLVHRMGNAILTGASNLLSGLQLTDMETCYKAFTREVIESIRIDQDRFGIEPEITAKLARRGFRFVEVPISYTSRGYSEGKKIGVKDLINAIYCIGRYGVSD